jgi:cell division protease FtsH
VQYGMQAELGPMAYEEPRHGFLAYQLAPERHYSEQTGREIECAIRQRLNQALLRASAILRDNRPLLERASRRLLDEETLEGEALDHVLAEARRPEREGHRLSA